MAVQGGISINEPPHLEMAFTINFFGQLGMVCGVVLVANQWSVVMITIAIIFLGLPHQPQLQPAWCSRFPLPAASPCAGYATPPSERDEWRRQRSIGTGIKLNQYIYICIYIYIDDKYIYMCVSMHILCMYRQTDRQTDRQAGRQAGRQTDRQIQ